MMYLSELPPVIIAVFVLFFLVFHVGMAFLVDGAIKEKGYKSKAIRIIGILLCLLFSVLGGLFAEILPNKSPVLTIDEMLEILRKDREHDQ